LHPALRSGTLHGDKCKERTMKINPVKRKLKAGEPVFGTWLSLGDLYASRVLARLGFDWLTLDMEHSAIDWSRAATIFAAVADAGCVPLVRVPEGSHHYIKRALDAGAWGIVVPMVDTVEQAQAAIAAAKYPPEGNRSVGGGMHSMNFAATADEYYQRANEEILVVLQTESPHGVENAEAIYSLPGCDAIFIGPNDLRFQMRRADGAFPTPHEHEALVQQVIAIGRRVGTPTGIHVMDVAAARQRVQQGMQFLAIGSELRMMTQKAQEILHGLAPGQAVKEVTKY
jgi:4-hydroxy-2-oxoheptanedioate aldolase